jgi:hypothetical protein
MADLFGRGIEQHVAILGWSACTPGLEKVLHTDTNLALDAADGLLEHAGEDGIRCVYRDGVLKLFVCVIHSVSPLVLGACRRARDAGSHPHP